MGWFPCFGSDERKGKEMKSGGDFKEGSTALSITRVSSDKSKLQDGSESKKETSAPKNGNPGLIAAQTFTFWELSVATKNFRQECLLGEGGFGRVYKGRLERTGQVVAVKQLDHNGLQGNKEFLVELLMLNLLYHPNLVSLIGYCSDGYQRILVYEFMPLGSLEDHLHDVPPHKEPLDWNTRMKIAAGAAKGLQYLHEKANPPVIHGDFKSSNILLDEGYFPKLSDFGLAKLGPVGSKEYFSAGVMGTYGYCAPELDTTRQLTLMSDVYSFGVVFLELITGRKAFDIYRPDEEKNLVAWAQPLFKDRRNLPKMADPLLQGRYPMRALYQALSVAFMCLEEQAATRPHMGYVVDALSYLASQTYDPNAAASQRVGPSTLRPREDRRNLGSMSDNQFVHSPHRNSAEFLQRDLTRGSNRGDSAGGSGRKGVLDEFDRQDSQSDSPIHGTKARDSPKNLNHDLNCELAIAEAKVWGENQR